MKKKLSDIDFSQKEKIAVPDFLHFVWIGDTNNFNTDYIDVWRNTNIDKEICFWYDDSTLLINLFHEAIHEYVLNNDFDNSIEVEKEIKNEAFFYFFSKLNSGFSFDELVMGFLEGKGIPCRTTSKPELNPWLQSSGVRAIEIMQLFTHEFKNLFKYYCYEIILRGNLASASDIVRLLIIYTRGGIYIDIDTLPYTEHLFHRTNQYLKENNIIENDFLRLSKTVAILRKVNLFDRTSSLKANCSISCLENKSISVRKLSVLIEADMEEFSLQRIEPLGKVFVHKNFLSLGSLKRLKGIYFNNIICSHSNSKAIRIILRTMHKRYVFLEKNNCIFNFCSDNKPINYLSRILSWRSELITRQFSVTPILTGPGLIVEVLLGLAYSVFELHTSTTPASIAEYMQDENLGIVFYQHNLDTPEGMSSAWRK